MADASKRIGRLRRIDRAAVVVITLGGIAVVVAVLGILVFVASEAWPLFRAASVVPRDAVRIETSLSAAPRGSFRAIGVDEYRKYVYAVEPDGRVVFYRYDSGERAMDVPIEALTTAAVVSSSKTTVGHDVAAGLSDGRVAILQVRYVPAYEGARLKDVTTELRQLGTVLLDSGGRAVRQVSYLEQDGRRFVAGLVADTELAYTWTNAEGVETRAACWSKAGGSPTFAWARTARCLPEPIPAPFTTGSSEMHPS